MMCTESLLGILMSRAQADVQRDYSSKQQMRERATQTTTNRQLRRKRGSVICGNGGSSRRGVTAMIDDAYPHCMD